MAELCKDPQFLLDRAVSQLRAEAIERGEVPPMYYRIEPFMCGASGPRKHNHDEPPTQRCR
jgi:hypothetical protein